MRVDLHLHSTASDGTVPPDQIPELARGAGLTAFALTDHDCVDGVEACRAATGITGPEVVAGCEISVQAWWGELHLLAFFVPTGPGPFQDFLDLQRDRRSERAASIMVKLDELGVGIPADSVDEIADGAVIARPHIARAMVGAGRVSTVYEAFDRFLSDSGPANVLKELPELEDVTALVRSVGGVTSAAHLKERASRKNLRKLMDLGVDGVEALHPSHDQSIVRGIMTQARKFGLLLSGGSDWHGVTEYGRNRLGQLDVPVDWLETIRALHESRVPN